MQARRPAVRACTTVPIELGNLRRSETIDAIGHPAGSNVGRFSTASRVKIT
jgi:hypothetical protein